MPATEGNAPSPSPREGRLEEQTVAGGSEKPTTRREREREKEGSVEDREVALG